VADDLVLNEFDSDTHRRVCANLSVPRSAAELAAFLSKHDPHVEDDAYSAEGVQDYLDDLEADGLVRNVGSFEVDPDDPAPAAREVLAAVNDDDDLITIPKAKADGFAERVEREDAFPYLDSGDHFVMTQLALDRINGPIPGESPPLTGRALRAAEAENERLQQESDERARQGMLDAAERLREQADELEKEAKK
jgi:hypothetical protein